MLGWLLYNSNPEGNLLFLFYVGHFCNTYRSPDSAASNFQPKHDRSVPEVNGSSKSSDILPISVRVPWLN